MEEYKPINFTYYNPKESIFKASRSYREETRVYFCNNAENCDAYKRKRCVMVNFGHHDCPYGKIERQTGYTKAARKCGDLIRKKKDKYGKVAYYVSPLRFLCSIGDYVYLGLPYLINYQNSIRKRDFFIDKDMIKKEFFTPEFVIELIKYRPLALFGGEIQSYQKEDVPKFCNQLKRYFPDMFEKVKEIYPDIDNMIENINYVGKRARLKTLLPGKIKLSTDILNWDGELIRGVGKQISFWGLKDEELIITPNDDTFAEIYDNDTVTEETEFEDE